MCLLKFIHAIHNMLNKDPSCCFVPMTTRIHRKTSAWEIHIAHPEANCTGCTTCALNSRSIHVDPKLGLRLDSEAYQFDHGLYKNNSTQLQALRVWLGACNHNLIETEFVNKPQSRFIGIASVHISIASDVYRKKISGTWSWEDSLF